MSNIQPIKVESTKKQPYKFVEWKLHDKCNYDCYFCGDENKKGWDCYAGINSVNIEPNMKFRGGCKRDPTPMKLGEFTFFDKPFKCDVDSCYCALDMITTKIKNMD